MKPADDQNFTEQVRRYTRPVLELCRFAVTARRNPRFPCNDYLSHLHQYTARLEELIDSYGAQKNEQWFPFREAIAAGKLFSSVTHSVLHIQSALHRYRLLDINDDCRNRTDKVLKLLKKVIVNLSTNIIDQAKRCDVFDPDVKPNFRPCEETLLEYQLPADRRVRHVARIGETVVHLSTLFLNMADDTNVQRVLTEPDPDRLHEYVPDPISEELLRTVETRFHNLQSMYDTYIFESDIEKQNRNLLYLRGHISIIYHLLATATELSHYYIRHMSFLRRDTGTEFRPPITADEMLHLLFNYPLHFAREYLGSAIHLCHTMIQRHSAQTSIQVPIPKYRGFHVRPSTLVAKIVSHYGSSVTMVLDGQEYDASSTLDLFRANEQINALKRRKIADTLAKRPELQKPAPSDPKERVDTLHLLFIQLVKEQFIVLYDTNLDFEGIDVAPDTALAGLAGRYMKHYAALGKIDIEADISVEFRGDNRALRDLEILANNGYGEDRMGNNTVLPEEISYLRR